MGHQSFETHVPQRASVAPTESVSVKRIVGTESFAGELRKEAVDLLRLRQDVSSLQDIAFSSRSEIVIFVLEG